MTRPQLRTDFLVIGSGIAGLTAALKLAGRGTVTVVTKKALAESNTNYAQGGIAAVLGDDDTPALHFADTMAAGADLCNEEALTVLVENGPRMIRELIDFGVRFTAGDSAAGLDLGKEGGHTRRRIAHAKDLTGAEIERALIESVRRHRSITLRENHMAVNLITRARLSPGQVVPGSAGDAVLGAYVLDREEGGIYPIAAGATLLATGGVGKVYLYTSNPDIASGDGIGMAYRAGAKIANMEFMQFHPTCLFHPLAKSFLISEAVRGEGAVLVNSGGEPFMERYHPMGSLAPRDVVARAIDHEMKRRGDEYVYLDTTKVTVSFADRFPKIYETLVHYGFDPACEPVPVVPAAHYMCGGVVTDLAGQTSIPGLFAAGETAHTGVHGANRLASNSLLEAVVFADRAAEAAARWVASGPEEPGTLPAWDPGSAVEDDEMVVIHHLWDEIRRLMWNYVGIARTDKRLARARKRIGNILAEIDEYYWRVTVTAELLELRNLAVCAMLIVECALRRKESRGLHYNLDYPERDDARCKVDTVVSRSMLEGEE